MLICTVCKSEVAEDDTNCPHCGANLTETPAEFFDTLEEEAPAESVEISDSVGDDEEIVATREQIGAFRKERLSVIEKNFQRKGRFIKNEAAYEAHLDDARQKLALRIGRLQIKDLDPDFLPKVAETLISESPYIDFNQLSDTDFLNAFAELTPIEARDLAREMKGKFPEGSLHRQIFTYAANNNVEALDYVQKVLKGEEVDSPELQQQRQKLRAMISKWGAK
jgi:hypothetical protein